MLYTLVRKTKTEGEFSKSESFNTYDEALKAFYQYLSNNIADTNVKEFHVTILDGTLMQIKTEHFSREEEKVATIPTEDTVL